MLLALSRLEGDALNAQIQTASFAEGFRRLGKAEQEEVLEMLTRQRVGELSHESKVFLIEMMQWGATRRRHEEAIRDLFLATRGADLTRLKRAVDAGSDYHDLAQLIFHDIDIPSIRQEILEHFAREGAQAAPEIKIISDLDDTLYRNWVDPRYPPKTLYPGVTQLYRELQGDVVFLTGRPGERGGYLEDHYRRKLMNLSGLDHVMLTGSFLHQFVRPWIFSRKWDNLERYRTLFPEMGFVMFGDSGQADPEFIREAIERFPGNVRAGLIHQVVPLRPERQRLCQEKGIYFFDTYVGAGGELARRGLLSREGLLRVAEAAQRELAAIPFPTDSMRRAREKELKRDLDQL